MPIRSNTQYGCSFIRAASIIALGVLSLILPSLAKSSQCAPFDHHRVFEYADIVFAANIKFSKYDFIQPNPEFGGYLLRSYYDYETLHIWKGDPGQLGTMYPGPGTSFTFYDEPKLSGFQAERIKEKSKKPPRLALLYAKRDDDGISFGGCLTAPDYGFAFTQRLLLGVPIKSYRNDTFSLPDAREILSFVDKFKNDNLDMTDYKIHDYFNNALDALVLLDAQAAMMDYLTDDDFLSCQLDSNSLNVIAGLISKLPDHAQQLYEKFMFMFYCSQVQSRLAAFNAFSQIVSSDLLASLIEQFMNDSSVRLRRAAAWSVSDLSDEHMKMYVDRADDMLASDNADLRIFAAVMLTGLEDIDLGLVKSVCEAQPASWQYHDDPIFSESVQDKCNSLTKTYQHALRKAGLLPSDRIR